MIVPVLSLAFSTSLFPLLVVRSDPEPTPARSQPPPPFLDSPIEGSTQISCKYGKELMEGKKMHYNYMILYAY